MSYRGNFCSRLQNSPYICVFKYVRAVTKRSGTRLKKESETVNALTGVWGSRLLRHALPISLLILRKKADCFAVYFCSWEKKARKKGLYGIRCAAVSQRSRVPILGYVHEIRLWCDHSNESHWAVLSCGPVYYAVQVWIVQAFFSHM